MMRRWWFAGFPLILVACGGSSDKGGGPVAPAPVAKITVSGPSSSLAVGATLQLTAKLVDASGNVLAGRTVTWSSTNTAVATVSDSGLVTGVSGGTATIAAASEGKTGFVGLAVIPSGAASVVVSPSSQTLTPGDTVRLSAAVKDFYGNVLGGDTVVWSSSDTTKATVSNSGLVTAVGTAVTPTISSIAPAQITLGATVTITGTGFATTTQGVQVTVAGAPVLVTAASATQLTVSVPPSLPCTPTGPAPVTVANTYGSVTITATSDGKSGSATLALASFPDSAQHQLQMANARTLAVGQVLLITDPSQVGCNELDGTAGRYLVDVYNDVQAAGGFTGFTLRGAGGVSLVASRAARAMLPVPAVTTPSRPAEGLPPGVEAASLQHLFDGHAQRMALTVAHMQPLIAELKSGVHPRASYSAASGTPSATVIPQTVGDTVTLKYGTDTYCHAFTNVSARVVYVGTHSIVLEDTAAPLANTMDSVYDALGQKFDTLMYPILTKYFGDPMAFDDSLSKIGKVTMLFTKQVNDRSSNVLGFVSPCDMLPASYDAQAPASNNTEVFYARVPTSTSGSASSVNVLAGWKRIMGATLIHETKHITAIAERFADPVGTSLEESWLEEGTAQVASEIYARTLYGVAWKSNANYASTVYCDLRGSSTTGPCAGAEYLMADQFSFLHDYMANNEVGSFLSPGSVDPSIYGSAWLFARWLLDQYSTNEADLMKPLVRDATMSGVQNVTDKTGRSWDELDGYFTMMLAADDYPGFTPAPGARYEEPSWNLRDIFAGLHQDLPATFEAWPLGVHAEPFGSWTTDVQELAGGSGSFFDISGSQSAPQLLDLHALGGGLLSPGTSLRLAILRIQ